MAAGEFLRSFCWTLTVCKKSSSYLAQRNQVKIEGKEGMVREEPVTNESDRI